MKRICRLICLVSLLVGSFVIGFYPAQAKTPPKKQQAAVPDSLALAKLKLQQMSVIDSLGKIEYKILEIKQDTYLRTDLIPDSILKTEKKVSAGTWFVEIKRTNKAFAKIKRDQKLWELLNLPRKAEAFYKTKDLYYYSDSTKGGINATTRSYFIIPHLFQINDSSLSPIGKDTLQFEARLQPGLQKQWQTIFADCQNYLTDLQGVYFIGQQKIARSALTFMLDSSKGNITLQGNFVVDLPEQRQAEMIDVNFEGKHLFNFPGYPLLKLKNPFYQADFIKFSKLEILIIGLIVLVVLMALAALFIFVLKIPQKVKVGNLARTISTYLTTDDPEQRENMRTDISQKIQKNEQLTPIYAAIEAKESEVKRLWKSLLEVLTTTKPGERNDFVEMANQYEDGQKVVQTLMPILEERRLLPAVKAEAKSLLETLAQHQLTEIKTDIEPDQLTPNEIKKLLHLANSELQAISTDSPQLSQYINSLDPAKQMPALTSKIYNQFSRTLEPPYQNQIPEADFQKYIINHCSIIDYLEQVNDYLNENTNQLAGLDEQWNQKLNHWNGVLQEKFTHIKIPPFSVNDNQKMVTQVQEGFHASLRFFFQLHQAEARELPPILENSAWKAFFTPEGQNFYSFFSYYNFKQVGTNLDHLLVRLQRLDHQIAKSELGQGELFYEHLVSLLNKLGLYLWPRPKTGRQLEISQIKLFDPRFNLEVTSRAGQATCKLIEGLDPDLPKGQFPIHISRFEYELFTQNEFRIMEKLNKQLGAKEANYEVIIFENRE